MRRRGRIISVPNARRNIALAGRNYVVGMANIPVPIRWVRKGLRDHPWGRLLGTSDTDPLYQTGHDIVAVDRARPWQSPRPPRILRRPRCPTSARRRRSASRRGWCSWWFAFHVNGSASPALAIASTRGRVGYRSQPPGGRDPLPPQQASGAPARLRPGRAERGAGRPTRHVVALDNVVVLRTIWETRRGIPIVVADIQIPALPLHCSDRARRRHMVLRVRMTWAPCVVIQRSGTRIGLGGTCSQPETGYREAARQQRAGHNRFHDASNVHGGPPFVAP
jgi:hypothetical protein